MVQKKKKCLSLMTFALAMLMVLFAIPAKAQQQVVKMKNGSMTVPSTGSFLFFDSGGEHQKPPVEDQPNDFNWANIYQSPELYELTFVPNSITNQVGVKVTFDYVNINNDWLYVYEGTSSSEGTLIAAYTGDNDFTDGLAGDGVHYTPIEQGGEKLSPYENNGNKLTVQTYGPITIRFEADDHWRDHGWRATVQGVTDVTVPTPPVVLMQKCANALQLFQTCVNSSIYYAIGYGSEPDDPDTRDPLSVTESYTPGEVITLPENANFPVYVKAIAKIGNNSSSIVTYKFEDALLPPSAPTLAHVDNTNLVHITTDVYTGNDTYYVRYTTSGEDPTSANQQSEQHPEGYLEIVQDPETKKVDAYIEITEPCTLQAVKRGTTCPENFSQIVSLTISTVYVPAPVITIADGGSTTITCPMDNNTIAIKYTTDGSDPTTSSTAQVYNGAFTVVPGTTVKAYAYVSTTGYEPSPVASEIYVPAGGSGVYGGTTVLLDDREEHSWSYYSDNTNPIRSLNPADVKITYFGNGTNTVSTSNNANPGNTFTASTYNNNEPTVQVSYNETENTFIYLKTLERADGATSTNPTGNCAYTTIPNPFSKRPTYGTGDTRWRGFYGWRVKAVRGGSIQNYAVGATIPAETEIQFVPAGEYGMEVELEALWARAYVVDGNNSTYVTITDQNVGYERNFVILRGDNDYRYNRLTNTGYPVTVTAIFPNGTSDGTTQATQVPTNARFRSGFDCAADIKIEYIRLYNNNTNTLTANNHNLIIGRGVTGYNNGTCATLVRGMGGGTTSRLNYTIRLESGVFNYVSFTAGYYNNNDQNQAADYTFSGTNNNVKGVLGSDYDRAVENASANYNYDNAPLRVVYNMIFGATPDFSNQTETEYFNATIKSGYFGSGFTGLGSGSAANSFYLGLANTFNTGKRKLTIEGGNLNLSIAGGIDEGNTSNDALIIRMKGGKVAGSVYGAAAFSSATGGRRFIITGGTVNGWIAGGCNGTQTTGGKLTGSTFIYFGGNAQCTSNGSNTTIGPGNATGGNIFGAGSGNASATQTATVGEVDNSTIVIADNAEIERSVYGGGNYGYVADGTGHKSDIYVLGGTVKQSVFGGSNMQKGQIVNIWVKDGTVQGNVYGGSNTQGIVNGLATINMSGGNVTNIFGGGFGANTNMASGTVVNVSNGTINNNVYGGGELGTITGNTNVTVSGGTMKNVFGAGKGGNTTAQVSGQTYVTVTGGTISQSVYGGGENGDVMFGGSGSGAAGGTETFNDVTATTWNTGTSYIPEGWNRFVSSNDYAYTPRVSNYANYNYLQNNDGNYLLFSARTSYYGTPVGSSYAIMPKYDDITAVSFKYRFRSASYGQFTVGYVTNNTGYNTFTELQTVTRTAQWTTVTLSETQINTINSNNGYIAFRFTGTSNTNNPMYSAAIDDVVVETAGSSESGPVASTVTVSGGSITGDVFGGGRMGKTGGSTVVNIDGGSVEGSVFGGAFGSKGTVYVAGLRTVNMRGGTVNKNVYGGSRNADDALTFSPGEFNSSTETEAASVVNYAGGHVFYQVFASGYFGNVFGSTYAFIGENAIMNAPHHIASDEDAIYNAAYYDNHEALRIDGSVWAGGDFGNYDGTKFGDPTVTGNSCIYVDGTDYDTQSTSINNRYMNIGGSLFGCGTSCDAGKGTRHIIVRQYGDAVENPAWNTKEQVVEKYTNATRSLYSIQRADFLDIENAHINLLGQGKINSLVSTEHYSIHEFNWVRVCNGSSLFLYAPADQIVKFGSYSVDDVYKVDGEPTYTKVVHAGSTTTLDETPNKIRVNGGSYIMVHHDGVAAGGHTRATGYGELEGFAYMMTEGENETCAYARPRQGTDDGNTIPNNYDNPNDGGWVSYNSTYNTFYDSGTSGCGTEGSGLKQMPYENHTASSKNGEQYFRIWRYGSKYLYREGVFVAQSDGTSNFSTTDVTIPLPASLGEGSYFRIKSLNDGNTTINYGDDVMTVNTAYTEPTVVNGTVINPEDGNHSNWMYFSTTSPYWTPGQAYDQSDIVAGKKFITDNPNVNFGLVAIPQGSINGQQTLLICENSDEQLALAKWYNTDETQNGSILFRLTYNNALTNNVVWDPITIVFEHVLGNEVKEEITVKLTITTLTNIEQPFSTEVYAIMRGNDESKAGTYTAKVVLPQYVMNVNETGEISQWTCTNVQWNPNTEAGFNDETWVTSNGNPYLNTIDKFALTFKPGLNYDQTTGWDEYYQGVDLNSYGWNQTGLVLGRTTARDPIAFDFTLQFDEGMHVDDNVEMGTLVFTMHFTNYAGASPTFEKDLTITVHVWRIGVGAIYYLDGVNGNNLYSGTYPNAAKKTLSGIFNRTDYRYGDYIFIVNTVTAKGNLDWNGKQYQEVTLYRYPGRHLLADYNDLQTTSIWEDYDKVNNACFEGPLVQVGGDNAGNMTMNGIVLDGFHELTEAGTKLYPQLEGQHYQTGENTFVDYSWNGTYVNPSSPLVNIQSGSTLSMYGQSRMTGNYSNNDGGAVYNAGTFNIYDGSEISGNAVLEGKNGGGVYLAPGSTLQLSDLVTINDNHLFTAGSDNNSDVEGVNNNVYLPQFASTVTVGTANTTDNYTALDNESRIGITSLPEAEWIYQGNEKWYLPVAYSDGGLANYLQNIIDNGIIFDDKEEYDVVTLNNADWVNNPTDYLYFVGTWVTAVRKNPQHPDEPNNFNPSNIDTREELAWLISYVNGLNHADPHPDAEASLAADLDMTEHIWVPIGSAKVAFEGTFEGNGHVVTGLRSPLNNTHMGMFGITNNATISDLVAQANFSGGTMKNIGTLIGTMQGGKLYNVEAAGILNGTNSTLNVGGLVGNAVSGVIHSGFAVNTMTGGSSTVVGGLVGTNGADLYNSYANAEMSANSTATTLGGLVGINETGRTVENCYVINPIGPAFAYNNKGYINYCYGAKPAEGVTVTYVAEGTQPTTHGTYDVVKGRKELGYMYYDNVTEIAGSGTNNYIKSEIAYANSRISTWPGLLSTLNQWVVEKNTTTDDPLFGNDFTPWFRSTSSYLDANNGVHAYINGDLPVLGFPKDNAMGTLDSDGKFLRYGSNVTVTIDEVEVNFNGVDDLLGYYNDNDEGNAEPDASIFHYGKAEHVKDAPTDNVKVFINEDAVLIQDPISSGKAEDQYKPFEAVVGITFDNSDHGQHAYDYYGNKLDYDWHLMSTPLSDAALGIAYEDYSTDYNYWDGTPEDRDKAQAVSVFNSYMPDMSRASMEADWEHDWDFYTYYEPEYHWINFKRNINSHHHFEPPHDNIPYEGFEQNEAEEQGNLIRGRGYMMAIDQDSYLSSNGKLNNGDVTIKLTISGDQDNDPVPTKDWGSNLVGNPYQAYLNLAQLCNKNNYLNGSGTEESYSINGFYIYDADNGTYGPFITNASVNTAIPSQFIHPHQAFFVVINGLEGTEKDLTFTREMASTTSNPTSYYRGEEQPAYPLVNVFAENESGNRDLVVIELNRPELGGVRKVENLRNANFKIWAHLDSQDFGLLFTPEGTAKVPVHFKASEDGTYTLRWNTENGYFTSLRLVDNMTGVNYDMLANDSYTFEAQASDYSTRFYITYACTGIEEDDNVDNFGNFAFFDGSEWVINGKGQLDVVDVLGRVIYSERLYNDQNRVSLNNVAKGVYLLRVAGNKNVKVQKIVVQ